MIEAKLLQVEARAPTGTGSRDCWIALVLKDLMLQAIEAAIEAGLPRVEAGAQGEHKIQRGYLPSLTHSSHYIRDPEFRGAVAHVSSSCMTGREAAQCQQRQPPSHETLCDAPPAVTITPTTCKPTSFPSTLLQFLRRESANIDYTLDALTAEASPYKSLT